MNGPTARAATSLAQATARRHALARIGRLALGITGFAVVSSQLGSRTPPVLASHLCADPVLCGLYGYSCADSSCGGTLHSCPTGFSPTSGYWTRCCYGGDGYYSNWAYKDCCRAASTSPCGHHCANNSPQIAWCPKPPEVASAWYYRCTIAVYLGPC